MAQPVMSAPTKLRIKLKGVPARVQNATIHQGPVQAVQAHLQLQDWRAAVEAFSKQGANGLPGGMLLDPWNEEAERQARQEVVPHMPRMRKRRADAPAEASLAEDYPKYLTWAVQHHKKQRSQEPKRVRKSPRQLSKSMQRIFSSGAQEGAAAAAPKPAPQPLQHQRQAQPQQRQQQQQPRQQQRPSLSAGADQRKQQRQPYVPPPRPPSPQLDDPMQLDAPMQLAPQLQQLLPVVMQGVAAPGASAPQPPPVPVPALQPAPVSVPADQQRAAGQTTPQPVPVPAAQQAAAAQPAPASMPAVQQATAARPAAVQPQNQSQPQPDAQQPAAAAAAAQQLQQPSAAAAQQEPKDEQRAPAVPVQVVVPSAGQEQKQQQELKAAAPCEQPSQPANKQVEQQVQGETAAAANKQATAKQPETEQVLPKQAQQQAPAKQPQKQAPAKQAQKQAAVKQAQTQAPAKQPQEKQVSSELLPADESNGIATRLRRRQATEPEPPAKTAQQQQQKQAKGKQKQKAEASEDSGPPAKKARTAEQAATAAPAAAAPAKGSDGGSAAAAKGATPAKAAKGGKQAAAAAAKASQQPAAKAASGDTPAKASAKAPAKAAAAASKPAAKPAAAGKGAAPHAAAAPAPAGKAAAPAAAATAGKGAASAQAAAGQAKPEGATPAAPPAAADRAEGSGPAAAAAAVKPESPPSETSHQQPIAAVPQQVQQLQPPLVPQLPQEQTAVSRDRSQCSLQQPVESPAAVASTGAAGGLGGAARSAAAAAAAGLQHSLGVPAPAGLRPAGVAQQHKKHLLELEASAMTPAAVALGSLQIPTVAFRPLLPDRPLSSQEEAGQYLEGMVKEARTKKHNGDSRSKQQGGWDVHSLTYYAYSALEFLRYWDACHQAHKQFADAGRPTDQLRKRLQGIAGMGLLKQVSQLCTAALQNASNCRGQDVQKQALRMLLERLSAICQLRHLHSQREALSQHANLLKGALPASSASSKGQQQQQQVQRTGLGKPPARAVVAAAAAAPGGSSPHGKQAFNKRSPDDSNTSNQDRVNLQGMLNPEQHSPGLVHGTSPGAGSAGNGAAGGNGGTAGSSASLERARMVAESTCAEHLTELLKVTDGMHQTVMRMQQFLESPDVLADDDARGAALHISTLGLDAGMFSIPRVVAHAEAALVRIVRSGRRGMVRMAS